MSNANLSEQIRRLRRSILLDILIGPMGFLLNFALCLAAAAALASVSECARNLSVRAGFTCALLAAITGWLMWIRIRVIRYALVAKPRIVPYFESRLGAMIETHGAFKAGFALARKVTELDLWATRTGVTPLSTFGFNDDLLSQPMVWHPAPDGLATLRCMDNKPLLQSIDSTGALSHDLATLEAALMRAADVGCQFALLVRLGDDSTISPTEMDHREGSFW